jgi:predicted phosphodiesterase
MGRTVRSELSVSTDRFVAWYIFGIQTSMRKFLQRLLRKPVLRIADKYASQPDRQRVHTALTQLYNKMITDPGKRGIVIPYNATSDSFVILSDQHKGAKNGADDFAIAEKNYLSALDYYYEKKFHYIALGDVEELWENNLAAVKKYNVPSISKEVLFLQDKRFTKVFGNHDLYWDNDPLASFQLQQTFGEKITVYEGVILQTSINNKSLNIFLTHGHQGDQVSDGNWFSKWFIANVWAPLQSYLGINPNTPAYDTQLKSLHNRLMYEWVAAQKNILLITGHTHQPVFVSLTHIERVYKQLAQARQNNDTVSIELFEKEIAQRKLEGQTIPDFSAYKPTYFNTGCCCFDDGDITGIEITGGYIRLIKWEYDSNNTPGRIVLEEMLLSDLLDA